MRFPAAHTSTGHTHILRMDGKVFGLGRPIITVVQPTQSIMGKHATRGYAASSVPRRSLAQSKMRAVLVMVGDVLALHHSIARAPFPMVASSDKSALFTSCDCRSPFATLLT